MRLRQSLLTLLTCTLALAKPSKRDYNNYDYYVIELDPTAGVSLDEASRSLGVEHVGRAGELPNTWLVRSERSQPILTTRGSYSDPILLRHEGIKARAASHASIRSPEAENARRFASGVKYLSRQDLRQRIKRDDSLLHRAPPPPFAQDDQNNATSQSVATRLGFVDPLFTEQWHIVNDEYPQHMMNPVPVWEMGITGQGVISTLVDDGLDYTSRDLADNFDAPSSYDFNDHRDLPTPSLSDDHHGTRCAGQIGAAKNDVCGVGLAYGSKIAGVRILSGPISDVDEAAALNYAYQSTSIYSCSWGPPDDGKSMEGPSYLISKAVVNGVENGRAGKGSIYVFASGNGAHNGDQCNFDGYTNSIYSVTVAAVDYKGLRPYYSEACAANMVVAYSSGSGQHIVTTDVGENQCSKTHGGTSAAAPNAVGVFALALEVRPDLTWRDIQYLCVQSAQMINPDDSDWEDIADGRKYSYKYGFGVLNAYEYVKAAQEWTVVKPQAWFESPTVQINNGTMDLLENMDGGEFIPAGGLTNTISITKDMLESANFESLEHITVTVWISHTRRGDVEVDITSPHGIKSVLGAARRSDTAKSGYPGWTFMSVKHWGEDPVGDWTIRVADQASATQIGHFLGWRVKFWGTTIDASQAKPYELTLFDTLLPPPPKANSPSASGSATKAHPKPTDFLPSDHGHAPGQSDGPAFPTGHEDVAQPSASATPTPDEGWFSDMNNLTNNKKWFFAAAGAVILFGLGAAIFFWRRRRARLRSKYSPLGEEGGMVMSGLRGGVAQSKTLYEAFGPDDDEDDEDADEETRLAGGRPQDRSPGGLGFHEGFLEDDEPDTATSQRYRDEPDEPHAEPSSRSDSDGPEDSSTGESGDSSSWEQASGSQFREP